MEEQIKLEIITPEGNVFSEMVSSLKVPAEMGSMGILYNHAPLMTGLNIGIVEYTQANKKNTIALTGGFIEVKNNHVIILATVAETAEEIDVKRAEAAKERAEQRLGSKKSGIDTRRAELALARALNRLKAVHKI